jgi:hypothetical protein
MPMRAAIRFPHRDGAFLNARHTLDGVALLPATRDVEHQEPFFLILNHDSLWHIHMSRDGVGFRHLTLVPLFPGFAIVEPHLNATLHIIYICPSRIGSPCNTHAALFW